jgi:hypothetical protein
VEETAPCAAGTNEIDFATRAGGGEGAGAMLIGGIAVSVGVGVAFYLVNSKPASP